jgi:pre-mRNA-processing factor 19
VSPDEVSALETESSNSLPVSETTSLGVEGSYAALGGLKGEAAIYSIDADKLERQVPINEPITDTLWTGSKVVFATSQGSVKVYEGGSEAAQVSEHAGPGTALSVHPGGKILASVGSDKSILLYDLENLRRVSRAHVDTGKHHRHPALLQALVC